MTAHQSTQKWSKVLWILNTVSIGMAILTLIFSFVEGIFWVQTWSSSYGGIITEELTVFYWIWAALVFGLGITIVVFSIMYLVASARFQGDKTTKALALTSSIMFVSIMGLGLIFVWFGWLWWAILSLIAQLTAYIITIITWNRLRREPDMSIAHSKTVTKPVVTKESSLSDKLHELEELKAKGLLDAKEFKAAKEKLLKKSFE